MFQRLIRRLKNLFQRLFSKKQKPARVEANVHKEPAPPLSDTDLEFLFNELLEGVNQARGQAWAQKWLNNIEHRIPTERWLEWLQRFGDRLLASPSPNNELASRMVQLGELGVGQVGDVAYNIGMRLLTRTSGEPIWEYDGPDAQLVTPTYPPRELEQQEAPGVENLPEGQQFQTVSLEQLFAMMQEDENLRRLIAQQVGVETDDPDIIIQALIQQFQSAMRPNPNQAQP
jgi:hypothetical protein